VSSTPASQNNAVMVSLYAITDVGMKRQGNEDSFLVADLSTGRLGLTPEVITHKLGPNGSVLVVSDGLGGAAAGEIASAMAVQAVCAELMKPGNLLPNERLKRATEQANEQIWNCAAMDEVYKGMGATLTAALVQDNTVYIAQVGDSRAYIVRAGRLKQVTEDQSWANAAKKAGIELQGVPRNVILQALGTQARVHVEVTGVELRNSDYLLLCSDGLTNKVTDDELRELIILGPTVKDTCRKLIDLANQRGGEDNITVVLAKFEGTNLTAEQQSITSTFRVINPLDFNEDLSQDGEEPSLGSEPEVMELAELEEVMVPEEYSDAPTANVARVLSDKIPTLEIPTLTEFEDENNPLGSLADVAAFEDLPLEDLPPAANIVAPPSAPAIYPPIKTPASLPTLTNYGMSSINAEPANLFIDEENPLPLLTENDALNIMPLSPVPFPGTGALNNGPAAEVKLPRLATAPLPMAANEDLPFWEQQGAANLESTTAYGALPPIPPPTGNTGSLNNTSAFGTPNSYPAANNYNSPGAYSTPNNYNAPAAGGLFSASSPGLVLPDPLDAGVAPAVNLEAQAVPLILETLSNPSLPSLNENLAMPILSLDAPPALTSTLPPVAPPLPNPMSASIIGPAPVGMGFSAETITPHPDLAPENFPATVRNTPPPLVLPSGPLSMEALPPPPTNMGMPLPGVMAPPPANMMLPESGLGMRPGVEPNFARPNFPLSPPPDDNPLNSTAIKSSLSGLVIPSQLDAPPAIKPAPPVVATPTFSEPPINRPEVAKPALPGLGVPAVERPTNTNERSNDSAKAARSLDPDPLLATKQPATIGSSGRRVTAEIPPERAAVNPKLIAAGVAAVVVIGGVVVGLMFYSGGKSTSTVTSPPAVVATPDAGADPSNEVNTAKNPKENPPVPEEDPVPADTPGLVRYSLEQVTKTTTQVQKGGLPKDLRDSYLRRLSSFKEKLTDYQKRNVDTDEARNYAESALSQVKSIRSQVPVGKKR
jgi:serine/threonine protein phosphatase PrpC